MRKYIFSTISPGVKETEPAATPPGFDFAGPLKAALGICLLAAIMGSAIAWRVASRPDAPTLLPVLLWQMAVWLPWIGYFYAIKFLAKRIDPLRDATLANIAVHALAALLIATSHLAWYWQVSDIGSPLKGLPNTKVGVYAFFFVFWFLIDLLLYLAVLAGQVRREQYSPAAASHQGSSTADSVTSSKQFVVRQGRARHVVRADDIRWIEAQGYYAALHTGSGSYLIRQSLAKLENELDPERFIRVHRSTIVNITSISGLQTGRNGAVSVMLTDGGRRRVSRAGYKYLKTRLQSPD
jgi:hypothetical protein